MQLSKPTKMTKAYYSLLLFLCCIAETMNSQTSISGVVNIYTKVTAIDTCSQMLTVSDTTGFTKSMKIILVQMNGASINSSNNEHFGEITDMSTCGLYEINQIDSVGGSSNIFLKYKMVGAYNATSAAMQIVSYPTFDDVTVRDTIKALPWNGSTGGIVAFEVNVLTLFAPISASGAGFRGGDVKSYPDCRGAIDYTDYTYPLNTSSLSNGGKKGESITGVVVNEECGKGAIATGGGGGNNHKSGGGGGGNFGAGGTGGQNIYGGLLFFPCHGKNPGEGGRKLPNVGLDKIFFGGGGGAGHNREGSLSSGANGGGIILLSANTINGNGNKIESRGGDALLSVGDGAGGGGGGGSIIFLTGKINSTVNLDARGGTGGNSNSGAGYAFGTGGGGGGGRVLSPNTSGITRIVTGGNPGKNISNNSSNNGLKGDDGISITANLTFPNSGIIVEKAFSIVTQPSSTLVCTGKNTSLTVEAKGNNLKYQWQISKFDSSGFKDITPDTTLYLGDKTAILTLKNLQTSYNPYLYRCKISDGCNNAHILTTREVALKIKIGPVAIFTADINYNTVSFSNGSSNALYYLWDFGDGTTSIQVNENHLYKKQGSYNVVLTAFSTCDTVTFTRNITLSQPPKAGFTSNTQDYCIPAFVNFSDTSTNNVTDYIWVFAGGTPATSTDKSPTVTYAQGGNYDVSLIVKNGNGTDTLKRLHYIHVNDKPSAVFKIQQNNNSSVVSFLSTQTVGATSFSWDLGDGTKSTDANPQHTYLTSGTYIVKLTAINSCGKSSFSDTVRVIVTSVATVKGAPTFGCLPLVVQYSSVSTTPITGYQWTFPGGMPSSSSSASPSVAYFQLGNYDVTLVVSTSTGNYATTQPAMVQVFDTPTANFDFSVDSCIVSFTNRSSGATSYTWDFGDGFGAIASSPTPHTYTRNGTFRVTHQALSTHCAAAIAKDIIINCLATATNDITGDEHFVIYPNPTSDNISLEFKNTLATQYKVSLINAQGQTLHQQNALSSEISSLEMQDVPSGIYWLQVWSDKEKWVRKVVKF